MNKQLKQSHKYETYDLSDPKTWQEMHRPNANQEISAASYKELLLRVLEEHRGWIRNDEFLAIVEKIFGPIFSKADRRIVNGRPKWMNAVDWAKASLTSANMIRTRSHQRNGRRESYIVLASHVELIRWVINKKQSARFKKRCPKCNEIRPLAEAFCGERAKGGCRYVFPVSKERVDRLPQ
ncbi:hypothetical protein [Gimesia sp.]|uniref:hypothetical protein n=1 Tax=Gimesia sp. TaxID=2024833 RepID=UPI003A95293D